VNVAFMVGLAFAIAASCNFPVLLMSLMWRGTTTLGALVGGVVGLVTALVMVVLSKGVWVAVFHNATAPFPYDNPAIFSMPLAFIVIYGVSKADNSRRAQAERAAFEAQFVRSETGIGAAGAHAH
jgi:cation/acetate symporter